MEKKINIISIILAVLILAVTVVPLQAQALTNKKIAKRYAKTHYTVVWIWKIYSKSNGNGYGTCEDGSMVAYNKKVKKGKRVVSYLVYNPYSNYCDDVVAVIDNKRIR